MTMAPRVAPEKVAERLKKPGDGTLLVCAYDDEQKCRLNALGGAIWRRELEERLPRLGKDQKLVFY